MKNLIAKLEKFTSNAVMIMSVVMLIMETVQFLSKGLATLKTKDEKSS